MELPKNITQIGEVGRDCKIYVEDYVVSYMKQLNRAARDKDMAVALFGKRREENGIVYYFVYGACKLDFLQREVRHLSQAQRQEIERYRRKYFMELAFVGYRLLDGDMIEGFHICEQDICRYISGYAQFYEKNDAMLAYMLDVREEAAPEQVNQEKYEEVKKRQEERRIAAERPVRSARMSEGPARAHDRGQTREASNVQRMPASVNLQKMRLTAVGVFALLCLLGIATFRDAEKNQGLQTVQSTGVDARTGSDAAGVPVVSDSVQKDMLVMEDKLEQALLQENSTAETKDAAGAETAAGTQASSVETLPTEEFRPDASQSAIQPETQSETQPESQTEELQTGASGQSPETVQESGGPQTTEKAEAAQSGEASVSEPVSSGAVAYVIQPGDTLIAISKRQYGTDIRVADICNLNKISNPDDIKEGQVIMLPR